MGLCYVRLDTCFGGLGNFSFSCERACAYCDELPQILCVIPVPILRWVLVGVAFALSGYFLVANVYPILASVSPDYRPTLIPAC